MIINCDLLRDHLEIIVLCLFLNEYIHFLYIPTSCTFIIFAVMIVQPTDPE